MLAAATHNVGWKVAAARQMLRVKNILGERRSETSDPVVRYAAKRASTSKAVDNTECGRDMWMRKPYPRICREG